MARIKTPYIHTIAKRPVVISQGIGEMWSIYIEKENGSLRRCKQFENYKTLEEAYRALIAYKGAALTR